MTTTFSQEPISRRSVILMWLISIHTSLLIASNAGGAKLIAVFGGLSASATVFSYALTFPIADIINELAGPHRTLGRQHRVHWADHPRRVFAAMHLGTPRSVLDRSGGV